MVAFRVTLPTLEQAERIYALDEAGHTVRQITVRVFGTPHRHGLVKDVLRSRHDYDPYIDRVAVDRALAGDAEVWESLTHYERREVMLAIHERRQREQDEDTDFRETWVAKLLGRPANRRDMGDGWLDLHGKCPEWVVLLADSFGLTPGRLLGEAARYAAVAA